ncbi:metallophosphoesterase family protein [Halobacillus shinanisalinarum]|uniref:Metallophosphoesterase family protein n=1 Tax=Halobacillus shinanisalinarum TaxID=2932258 RepID=A0ABY4GZI3_9BACI|nr:metallophosphoesterase family protein [Halobacillus shinanisalinarum]UOQ93299.1 metallophosphoesterase family protein [Halobacillus shinanisalinarum]
MKLKSLGISIVTIAITAILITTNSFSSPVQGKTNENEKLQFNADGKYRIVQFNDIQDDEDIDPRTIELMNTVLDEQKPDLAILNGDMLNADLETPEEVKQAIKTITQPMEDRGVQWAVTFGNHDEDHTPKTGLDEEEMLEIYMSYEHNVNKPGPKDITGTGNTNLVINNSKNTKPAFNIWLFDSGRYAPEEIAGQDFEGYQTWDWLRHDQVQWYTETSKKLEKTTGHKVPSLAFMHIPLPEFEYMWYASPSERTEESHAKAVEKHNIRGEKNECVCTGPFNSGMFAAMLERGDVKGVFSGHDHINTYVGDYYGIKLGYAGSVGFGAYGLGEEENHRLRGARVFNLDENTKDGIVDTEMVFAKDYGIQ